MFQGPYAFCCLVLLYQNVGYMQALGLCLHFLMDIEAFTVFLFSKRG